MLIALYVVLEQLSVNLIWPKNPERKTVPGGARIEARLETRGRYTPVQADLEIADGHGSGFWCVSMTWTVSSA